MTTTSTNSTDDTNIEQSSQQLQQFYLKITTKCERYRGAVEKDKLKKSTLYTSLEKDFGSREGLMKAIEERKSEMKEEEQQEG
eukprot:CAMPEP_0173163016 /NCGR_PEP_ID=MMETSP1105-20130129/19662_1 /TAXON_ID=2985 /ORGANISM="Ochromonas sp., Strain BG-1" /LENGTH=82 /DNA_ID=CAMNT_0014082977 /DNA_START=12 /DNA_END=260 /DNA_ORIENTATION=+